MTNKENNKPMQGQLLNLSGIGASPHYCPSGHNNPECDLCEFNNLHSVKK